MTLTYDLRTAFLPLHRAFAPSPATDASDTSAGGEEGASSQASPDSSPADTGDEDTDTGDDDEPSEAKLRSDEARKYRHRAKTAEAEVATLRDRLTKAESSDSLVTDLRKQNAFLLAAMGRVTDLDAAWKLADTAKVKIEDGKVTGMDDVVDAVMARYPYLAPADDDDTASAEPYVPLPVVPSGQPANGRKGADDTSATDRRRLEAKFPALARAPRTRQSPGPSPRLKMPNR